VHRLKKKKGKRGEGLGVVPFGASHSSSPVTLTSGERGKFSVGRDDKGILSPVLLGSEEGRKKEPHRSYILVRLGMDDPLSAKRRTTSSVDQEKARQEERAVPHRGVVPAVDGIRAQGVGTQEPFHGNPRRKRRAGRNLHIRRSDGGQERIFNPRIGRRRGSQLSLSTTTKIIQISIFSD